MNVAVSPQHFRQLVALKDKIARYELAEERETYEESLSAFVRAAWPSIVSSDYQSCWAIDALCDHLEAVTPAVNMQRAGPFNRKSHCKYGHPLSGYNLMAWKHRHICRTCHNNRRREYRKRVALRRSEAA